MKIKTCGLFRHEDIAFANALKPDMVGFVFAKSRRAVSVDLAYALRKDLLDSIRVVGVFVDSPQEYVCDLVRDGIIDMIQLHGSESEAYVQSLKSLCKAEIIKAIGIKNLEDFFVPTSAEYVLYDNAGGGSGTCFDWDLLQEAQRRGLHKKFFLAGGIHTNNIESAIKLNPYAIDISSGIESDGVKDFAKMRQVIEAVRGA